MSRAESVAVGLAVGLLCPLLLFVLGWWTTAALYLHRVLPIPEKAIGVAALAGLVLGIVLDGLFLRRWMARFYTTDAWVTVVVYLFCSAIAVAFCMGLPLGNLVLGTLAGAYVGRRHHHAGASTATFCRAARNVSLLIAVVTAGEALPIGLLALREGVAAGSWGPLTGLREAIVWGLPGVAAVILLCGVLAAVQFWFARTAAGVAFRCGDGGPAPEAPGVPA